MIQHVMENFLLQDTLDSSLSYIETKFADHMEEVWICQEKQ